MRITNKSHNQKNVLKKINQIRQQNQDHGDVKLKKMVPKIKVKNINFEVELENDDYVQVAIKNKP